jgi:hypothetical protein
MDDYQRHYVSDENLYDLTNPATGLPMVGLSVDSSGNPFGADVTSLNSPTSFMETVTHGRNNIWVILILGGILMLYIFR